MYVQLIKNQTGVTFFDSFTQPVTTNNVNNLTSLTMYYSSQCVMGIDFVFSDGIRVTTGSSTYENQLSGQATLDLTNKRMCEVDSYCADTSDFIRICSLANNGTKTCINVGNLAKVPVTFVCMNDMNIYSYVGNYFSYYGWYCLSNLGVNVITKSSTNTTC